jgi:hypothetical protein
MEGQKEEQKKEYNCDNCIKVNGNGQKTFRSLLVGEIRFIWPIITACFVVAALFYKIQTDIELIKQNHEAHIEQIMSDLKSLHEKDNVLTQENKDLLEIIIKNNSKIDQLLGAHNIKIEN